MGLGLESLALDIFNVFFGVGLWRKIGQTYLVEKVSVNSCAGFLPCRTNLLHLVEVQSSFLFFTYQTKSSRPGSIATQWLLVPLTKDSLSSHGSMRRAFWPSGEGKVLNFAFSLFQAEFLIAEEADILRSLWGHDAKEEDDYTETWEAVYSDYVWLPTQSRYELASVSNNADKLAAAQAEFEVRKSHG